MCLSSLRIDLVRDAQTAVSIPIPRIIRTYYPGFDIWFDRTVLPSLGKGRAILLARINGELTGFCVLKRNPSERKICTLYVFEAFRNRGVGSALVEYSLGLLDERFPLVTVPEELLPVYERSSVVLVFVCPARVWVCIGLGRGSSFLIERWFRFVCCVFLPPCVIVGLFTTKNKDKPQKGGRIESSN